LKKLRKKDINNDKQKFNRGLGEMRVNAAFIDNYAVSEVVGGILMVLVAVIAFSSVYIFLIPSGPDIDPCVQIEGIVKEDGIVVLRHVGGGSLTSFVINTTYPDNNSSEVFIDDIAFNYGDSIIISNNSISIGEYVYSTKEYYSKLIDESVYYDIRISYLYNNNKSIKEIFSWRAYGDSSPPATEEEDPYLISSLGYDTTDEDLIFFSEKIFPLINFEKEYNDSDINMDYKVNNEDVQAVENSYGQTGSPGWIREDINDDGVVNYLDVSLVTSRYGNAPFTFIYNWTVNGLSIFDLIMPFDSNYPDFSRDYSGDSHNGDIYGPIWTEGGKIGGAYEFDGVDDYITIPYCHSLDYIDEITVETWINTTEETVTISSFERDKYWELGLKNGVVQWTTRANDLTTYLTGNIIVNDGYWHHIAATYDSSNGNATIIVDGVFDVEENCHNPGEVLGDGSNPTGYIGRGIGGAQIETIFSSSFESESEVDEWEKNNDRTTAYWWQSYDFEQLGSDALSARSGSYSLGGTGNIYPRHVAYDRNGIDISNYEDVTVSVWYSYESTESLDDVGFYYWDGSDWGEIFEELSPNIGEGNQLAWTYAEASIPNDIDNLILEFWWLTSSAREYVAIDDLLITGIPSTGGGNNFSGRIDEFKIYNRALSREQIFQNHLCSYEGFSDIGVIVSDETNLGENWKVVVTPNNSINDDNFIESNNLQIIPYGGG
jgi:hypothetical protein